MRLEKQLTSTANHPILILIGDPHLKRTFLIILLVLAFCLVLIIFKAELHLISLNPSSISTIFFDTIRFVGQIRIILNSFSHFMLKFISIILSFPSLTQCFTIAIISHFSVFLLILIKGFPVRFFFLLARPHPLSLRSSNLSF